MRPPAPDNAVTMADKPNFDKLIATCPHTAIDGSGLAVGLPDGQMGNSEVGHLNLGSGRVIYQYVTQIDKAIADGDFYDNPTIGAAMDRVAVEGRALHLFGLVSDGLVHSSMEHLFALVEMARSRNVKQVYLHAFMDGRDTPPDSGQRYMVEVLERFDKIGLGKVATVSGRYYAMDRDKRWERNEKAYRAIVRGDGKKFKNPIEAIKASYAEGVTDEFIIPVVIDNGDPEGGRLQDRDAAIIFNFRADRVRQISQMLLGYENEAYDHPDNPHIELVTMTNYEVRMFEPKVAYQPAKHKNLLGGVISKAGLKQLRTAETEKYAHVTFFFNGGVEEPFEGEDRDLIPSPKVATYDLKPEMSSVEVADNAVKKIESGKYDLIVLNFANCDMVGHTGVFDAAKAAVEAVDRGLGKLLTAIEKQGGVAIITADHGNAEMMIDPASGGPFTAHTTNLVPCVLYDPKGSLGSSDKISLRGGGILADIAPTILDILGLEQPAEMTGKSLIVKG